MCKEAAAAIACGVQTLNGPAFGIQHLHLRIDAQTIQRAEQACSLTASVIRRIVQREQTITVLSEVFVFTLSAQLVVTLDGCYKGVPVP